eukprot:CAMPEP_0173380624 /NCGR_PEP_ID=MMETSP1356-20130122/3278_1 /TAXON_ID=77927 ORGANISM="Hemiselmis virescens, Strain PCC157" /NCGR_SAMPLE_ID=MMETSP1356 /ASSEMBLY_ACC=CAM_ASM_000847 /LENGTH=458 /DNA_ID=CAMNT_0014334287 /DNA_START=14 /DNA_END=1390 /DNA_ORIENTATION=+
MASTTPAALRTLIESVPDHSNPAVQGYKNQDRVKRDCEEVIANVRSLYPKVGNLVLNNGDQHTLLCLQGTIPMYVNNNKYNCPMVIWLHVDYPNTPPTCFVVPTLDMQIKTRHMHVDAAGFVYHHYLTQWNLESTLKILCDTLCAVFSKDPPVFARTRTSTSSSSSSGQASNKPSPHPASSRGSSAGGGSASQPPPSAAAQHAAQHAANVHQQQAAAAAQQARPPQHRPPPPPVQTAEEKERLERERKVREREAELREAQRAIEIQAAREREREQQLLRERQRAIEREKEEEENTRMELQAMCSSKLEVMLDEFIRRSDDEFEAYQGKQRKLEETSERIRQRREDLEREKAKLLVIDEHLDAAEEQMRSWKAARESRGERPVEELVSYSDALSRQLFKCTSQDKAIEDVLFLLDKALGNETLDCKRYLQLVAKYSKQQFFVKELANKIVKKRRQLGVY